MEQDIAFITISDIHINSFNYNTLSNQFFDKEKGFFTILRNKKDELKSKGIKFKGVIMCGDFFDTKIQTHSKAIDTSLNIMKSLVNEVIMDSDDTVIILIRGTYSHDYSQLKIFSPYQFIYPERFFIVDKPQEFSFDGYNILAIPEEYGRSEEELGYKEFFDKKYDLFAMHGFFTYNCFSKSEIEKSLPEMFIFDEEAVMKMARTTIAGHDHRHHSHGTIYYNGSFNRNNFGEEGEKGFNLITLNKDENKVEFIENELAPTYMSINSDLIFKMFKEYIISSDDLLGNIISSIIKFKEHVDYLKIFFYENDLIDSVGIQAIRNYFKSSIYSGNIIIEARYKKLTSSKLNVEVEDSEEELIEKDTTFEFLLDERLGFEDKILKFISIQNPQAKIDKSELGTLLR